MGYKGLYLTLTSLWPFQHPEVDVDHLFGNIEEVADVSQRLLTKLEEALNGKDFDQQVIGEPLFEKGTSRQ